MPADAFTAWVRPSRWALAQKLRASQPATVQSDGIKLWSTKLGLAVPESGKLIASNTKVLLSGTVMVLRPAQVGALEHIH